MPKSGLAAAATIPSAAITALLTNSSPVVAAIGALAALILAIGVARALVLTAKNGRMNITIGPPPHEPDPKDP